LTELNIQAGKKTAGRGSARPFGAPDFPGPLFLDSGQGIFEDGKGQKIFGSADRLFAPYDPIQSQDPDRQTSEIDKDRIFLYFIERAQPVHRQNDAEKLDRLSAECRRMQTDRRNDHASDLGQGFPDARIGEVSEPKLDVLRCLSLARGGSRDDLQRDL